MKKLPLLALLAILAFSAATTQAANITWGAPTAISGDTNVSTNGTLVSAFNIGGPGVASTTVNGTLFTAMPLSGTSVTIGNFTFSSATALTEDNNVGSIVAPFILLSAQYQALLSSVGGGPTAVTLTMSGLVLSATYEFQWWSNTSANPGPFITTATAGGVVTLSSNTGGGLGGVGGVGQYAIGSFTADANFQTIVFSNPNDLSAINGFQLRQTFGAPSVSDSGSTIALLFLSLGALFGASRLRAQIAWNAIGLTRRCSEPLAAPRSHYR
jgi:hypothetical protein